MGAQGKGERNWLLGKRKGGLTFKIPQERWSRGLEGTI